MGSVDLLPVGPVDEETLASVEESVRSVLGLDVRRLETRPVPGHAYDPSRNQHDSLRILSEVLDSSSPDAFRVLGVTEVDLFIPILTFVFGQAQVGGQAAIMSLARLRQEFYGLPPNPPILRERAAKEALHELGHTFGLVHCLDPVCAASLSTNVRQVDAKEADFCTICAALVARRLPAGSTVTGPGEVST